MTAKIIRFWELKKEDFLTALNSDEDVIFAILTDEAVLSDVRTLESVKLTFVPVDKEMSNASDAVLRKAVETKIESSRFIKEGREEFLKEKSRE